jgi:hypothetical protein
MKQAVSKTFCGFISFLQSFFALEIEWLSYQKDLPLYLKVKNYFWLITFLTPSKLLILPEALPFLIPFFLPFAVSFCIHGGDWAKLLCFWYIDELLLAGTFMSLLLYQSSYFKTQVDSLFFTPRLKKAFIGNYSQTHLKVTATWRLV